MRCSLESLPGSKLARLLLCGSVLLSFAGSLCVTGRAASSVPTLAQPIDWVKGPAKANLGTIAEVNVPPGYRFADSKGARSFLESAKQPVSKTLAGVLAPESGSGWVVFEIAEVGYVADTDKDQIDPAGMLKSVAARNERQNKWRLEQGIPSLSKLTWEVKPAYDASTHSLEWATRAEGRTRSQGVITHTVRLFGRHTVLDVVSTRPVGESANASTVKQLAAGVFFQPMEAYGDYRSGDKLAAFTLAGSMAADVGSNNPDGLASAEGDSGIGWFWIGLVVVVVVGASGALLLVKKVKANKSQHPMSTHVAQPIVPHKNGAAKVNGVHARNGSGPKVGAITTNGHHNNSKRRRMFNYHKFYTEMVLQGPGPSVGIEPYNGYELEAYRYAAQASAAAASEPTAAVHNNSEMIANQKTIIEVQTKLIAEQAKLIEEKSRLIAEKNQLLQRQSELIDTSLV